MMNKTIEHSTPGLQELLIRLERNNKLVKRLSRKLNSYTCEPTDRSCFEKLNYLKQAFQSFRKEHNYLSHELVQNKEISDQLKDEIKNHLDQFKILEEEIASYILSTNKYY